MKHRIRGNEGQRERDADNPDALKIKRRQNHEKENVKSKMLKRKNGENLENSDKDEKHSL